MNQNRVYKPAFGSGANGIFTYNDVYADMKSVLTYRQLAYLPLKRLIDFAVSFIGLIICLPIFLVVSALIKLDSPGPVFFKQERAGKNGETFLIYKFRSMRQSAETEREKLLSLNESDGPFFKIREDPRITRVGRFIRKYSIDELPQLINVLEGSMSLVGPRPALFNEIQQYSRAELHILDVTPGITCYWQISDRSDSAGSRLDLDIKYINEFNILIDMMILLKTPIAVFKTKGAY